MSAVCATCGGSGPGLQRCSACRRASYCGAACQRRDAAAHRRVCCAPAINDREDVAIVPPLCLADFAVSASPLGEGNLSTVYRAVHRATGVPVALKQLSRAALRRAEARAPNLRNEVLQEKALGAVLRHAAIPRLLGTFTEPDALVFVYELVDGCELWDVLTEPAVPGWAAPRVPVPLPPHAVAAVVAPLVDALAYLHGAGVAHRDVKPENIMLAFAATAGSLSTPRGATTAGALRAALMAASGAPLHLKLLDFGTAKDLVAPAYNNPCTDFAGTPDYMSPEAVLGRAASRVAPPVPATMTATAPDDSASADAAPPKRAEARSPLPRRPAPAPPGSLVLDSRADLWSLGAVAYHALAGVPPFRSASAYLTMRRVAAHDSAASAIDAVQGRGCDEASAGSVRETPRTRPSPPLLFPPGVPLAAQAFVQGLLRHDPAERLGVVRPGAGLRGVAAGALRSIYAACNTAESPPGPADRFADPAPAAQPVIGASRPAAAPPLPAIIDYDVVLRHDFVVSSTAGEVGFEHLLPLARDLGAVAMADVAEAAAALLRCDHAPSPVQEASRVTWANIGPHSPPRNAMQALVLAVALLPPMDRARLLHLLALRRRLTAPPVALLLSVAVLLARCRSAQCVAAASVTTPGVSAAAGSGAPALQPADGCDRLHLALGAARALRHVVLERRCSHAQPSPTEPCACSTSSACALAEHGPHEVVSWLVGPRRHDAAGDVVAGAPPLPTPSDADGDEDVTKHDAIAPGIAALPRARAAPQPPAALPSTAWRSASGQDWEGPFSVVMLAHPRMSASPVTDDDHCANAAMRAALAAVASMEPHPRALLLLGHLTAAAAYGRGALAVTADADALMCAIGAALPLKAPTSVWLCGDGVPATPEALGWVRLPVNSSAAHGGREHAPLSAAQDAAAAVALADMSSAGWVGGVRLLLLDPASLTAASLPPVAPGATLTGCGSSGFCVDELLCASTPPVAAMLWRQQCERVWLADELEYAPSGAQHAIVALRCAPQGIATLRAVAGSNVRVVVAPAPLTGDEPAATHAGDGDAPASVGSAEHGRHPPLCLVPPVTACFDAATGTLRPLPLLRVGRFSVIDRS